MSFESSPEDLDAVLTLRTPEDVEAAALDTCEASLEDLISEEGDSDEDEPFFVQETEAGGSARASVWQIDHSFGEYQFNARRFIEKMLSQDVEPSEALNMLQQKFTVDYGNRRSGASEAAYDDEYFPRFYLDFISIIGRPLKPLTKPSGSLFDNVTVTFQHYNAPYSAKHVDGIPFNLTGRTFRLAQAASREIWFIVMQPCVPEMRELHASASRRKTEKEAAMRRSGMGIERARELAAYVTSVFQCGDLLGEGVETSWRPGGRQAQKISASKWTLFQELFVGSWQAWASRHDEESFWRAHEPAFHAYDYGANIEIPCTQMLYSLPREAVGVFQDDDEEDYEQWPQQSVPRTGATSDASMATEDEMQPNSTSSIAYADMLRDTDGLAQLVDELEGHFVVDNIKTSRDDDVASRFAP